MKEFVFYTPEGTTQTPDGEEVENCQLLGFAGGKDREIAMRNLLKENGWIIASGFSLDEILSKEVI